jgi:hypothetical protein
MVGRRPVQRQFRHKRLLQSHHQLGLRQPPSVITWGSPTPPPRPTRPRTPTPTPTPSPPHVNRSGTIRTPTGGQASFTIQLSMVRSRRGRSTMSGGFSYNDPAGQLSFNATRITAATNAGNTASFTGTARIGSTRVTFAVNIVDNGYPALTTRFRLLLATAIPPEAT